MKKNILIAPKNDLSILYRNSLSNEYNFLFYIDNYKKDTDSIITDDINNIFYEEIVIVSPNYFSEIYKNILALGVNKNKISFVIPLFSKFWKIRSLFYASFMYKTYSFLENRSVFKDITTLKEMKNKHLNKRIFLIGNGPSLKIDDLDKLKNEITFAANKIYLSFSETKWRPSYYIVEDDLVFKQNYKKINKLNLIKLFPNYARTWGLRVDNGIYFKMNLLGPTTENFPNFNPEPVEEGLYWGSTVVYSMIQFAVYFGCKEIYLMGVDFSFDVPSKSVFNEKENRVDLICEGEVNHFHKDYRRPGEKWNLPNLDIQLKTFSKAKEYCDIHGIKIYNASRQTKLDVFEKIDFDQIFFSND